jgi:putative nucleotidyltransferase with HDIG domain
MLPRPDRHPLASDPLHEARRIRLRVRTGVYGGLAATMLLYRFVLRLPTRSVLACGLLGAAIAAWGIEYAFAKMFQQHKRVAYPVMLSLRMAHARARKPACEEAVELVARWLKADAALLACLHPDTRAVETMSTYSFAPDRIRFDAESAARLDPFSETIDQQAVVIQDLTPDHPWFPSFGPKHLVAYVPAIALGKSVGVLALVGSKNLANLKDRSLLTALGMVLGPVLDNICLYNYEHQAILRILCSALDLRDRLTEDHSRRVADLAVAVAKELGMDEEQVLDIERAAILHDIGKLTVPDAILSKPGPLTPEEWQQMQRHSEVGHQIVKDMPLLRHAAENIYAHHERFDGTGYPRGLKGEDIPLGSRIFAVVDAYDAITSDRPYRKAQSHQHALEELQRYAGTQFDPQTVEAFLNCVRRGDVGPGGSHAQWSPLGDAVAAVFPPIT